MATGPSVVAELVSAVAGNSSCEKRVQKEIKIKIKRN